MSQDQNAVIQTGPPRRFLRKGEGLKRFAAYKPPLPTTAKKVVQRRQTFVRFKLDRNSANMTKEPTHFLPPELLNDDSINLSTEIPKIAPPKIIHTPIRPNRNALGTVTNQSSLFTDSQINGNIDNLFKKIEDKKSALDDRTDTSFFDDHTDSFNCPGLKQKSPEDKQDIPTQVQKDTQPDSKREELSSKNLESSNETSRIAKPKRTAQPPKRSSPVSEVSSSDLIKHLDIIESTVNELREKLNNCACCATTSPTTTRRRPTTRAAARAAKSKSSETKPSGPSADADNITTKERLDILANEFAQLRARLDDTLCKK